MAEVAESSKSGGQVSLTGPLIKGISWISSKIGKPLNKFVREGTDVKVCLLRDRAIPCPDRVQVELEIDEVTDIMIVQFQARDYKKESGKRVWMVKEAAVKEPVEGAEKPSFTGSRMYCF
ncbi:hypothetical protein LINPERPRIM_LOCUS892 [Linum perenne]